MNCEICGIGMEQNATLFRVNAIGIKGIWRCRQHLTPEQSTGIDPTVKDIADVIDCREVAMLVDTLKARVKWLEEALKEIRDQDYRGNRCSCACIAKRTLAEQEAK